MAMRIRKNDVVKVICGDHRGASGKILRIDLDKGVVVVEGVNMVYRHVRPTRKNPQGGRIQKEAPIAISNVLPLDSSTGKGSRVRFVVEKNASGLVTQKKRVTVKGTTLHTLSRAEKARTA